MIAQLIPREEWQSLFERFNHHHEDWFVTVELHGRDEGQLEDLRELPLQNIAADLHGSPDDFVLVQYGPDLQCKMMHRLAAPAQLKFAWTDKGGQQVLQIQSASGASMHVRFRPAPSSARSSAIRLQMPI